MPLPLWVTVLPINALPGNRRVTTTWTVRSWAETQRVMAAPGKS
jgi:hypothetical protein